MERGIGIFNEIAREGRCSGKVDLDIGTVVGVPLQSMDTVEERYFKLVENMLSFLGFWHTQTYRERLLRYYLIGSMFFYSIPAQMCQFFTLELDLRSLVFILEIFICSICFGAAYGTGVLHWPIIKKIFRYVKQDWQQLKDDVELKIMKKHAHETKLFILICGFMFFLFLCLFVVPPLLRKILSTNGVTSGIDRFPIFSCLDYFFDRETYYYPMFISQTVMLAIGTIVAISCYSMYFWSIQHTCARLSIIKDKIHRPFINSHNENVLVKQIDLSHWMIDIIQCLARTTEFISLVNTLSEKCYLFQMLLAFLLVIINFLCLFQMPVLLEHMESKKDVIAFIVFIFGTLFPIYINCYIGQRLMDYSADVYKEACLIPIHMITLKTQKLLLTTLMMSAKPYTISIGKMFIASHEFFSDLFRTSLSFAMVLHSTQKI